MKKNVNFIFAIFGASLALLMVVSYAISIAHVEMNPDTSYYMGVSQLIAEGKIPYVDFRLDYTPLVMYIMAFPISIFGMHWGVVLGVQACFLLLDTVFLYLLLRNNKVGWALSLFGAVLLPLYTFMMEGVYFGLEVYVLFFGLLALLLISENQQQWRLLLGGLLCCCAFLSKQYGLGFLGVCGVWLFFNGTDWNKKFTDCLLLIAGFAAGLLFFIGFLYFNGYQLSKLSSLLGEGYGSRGFAGVTFCATWLLKRFPVVILAPMVLLIVRNVSYKPIIYCSIVGILGFMLQCYFREFLHYLILVMPFCILLTFCCINQLSRKYLYELLLCITFLSVVRMTPRVIRMDRSILHRTDRFEEYDLAQKIAGIVPVKSSNVFTYASDIAYCQFYNAYLPPCLDKYGFNATFYKADYISQDLVTHASYVLIDEANRYDSNFATESVNMILSTQFDSMMVEGFNTEVNILIYTRHND